MKRFVSKKKTTKILFTHKSWNHEIKLKSNKQFEFEFIYAFFEKKLTAFWKYLKKNLKKNYIKKSKSSTKYSIFFIGVIVELGPEQRSQPQSDLKIFDFRTFQKIKSDFKIESNVWYQDLF